MGSAGKWVLGLLVLLVGAVAVARTISSNSGSESNATVKEIQTEQSASSKKTGPVVAADVACKKPCVQTAEIADSAISTAKLAPGSVTLSKLAFDVPNLSELQSEIDARKSAEVNLNKILSDAQATTAKAEDVLQNTSKEGLDNEAAARAAADATLTSSLNQEIADRKSGDGSLTDALNKEIADRGAAVTTVATNLTSEIATRTSAITALRGELANPVEVLAPSLAVNHNELVLGSVQSDTIKDSTIQTVDIADGAVTNPKLAADAVTTDKIKDGEVKTADIGAGQVTGGAGGVILDGSLTIDDLGTGSVGSDEVVDNSLTISDLGTNSVGSDELANDAVDTNAVQNSAITTDKIATGNVTDAKLDPNGILKSFADFQTALATDDGTAPGPNPTDPGLVDYDNLKNVPADINSKTAKNVSCTKCVDDTDIADGAVVARTVASDAIVSANIVDNTVTGGATGDIALGTITGDNLASGAVGATNLAPDSVDSSKIANGTIKGEDVTTSSPDGLTSANIQDASLKAIDFTTVDADALTGSNIKDGTIGALDLGNDSVVGGPAGAIKDHTITADDIAEGKITAVELAANADSISSPASGTNPVSTAQAIGSVSLTNNGTVDHKVLLVANGLANCTTCTGADTSAVTYQLVDGTTAIGPLQIITLSATDRMNPLPVTFVATAASGPHAYKLQVSASNTGAATVNITNVTLSAVDLGKA